jgi:hypothetical protein
MEINYPFGRPAELVDARYHLGRSALLDTVGVWKKEARSSTQSGGSRNGTVNALSRH